MGNGAPCYVKRKKDKKEKEKPENEEKKSDKEQKTQLGDEISEKEKEKEIIEKPIEKKPTLNTCIDTPNPNPTNGDNENLAEKKKENKIQKDSSYADPEDLNVIINSHEISNELQTNNYQNVLPYQMPYDGTINQNIYGDYYANQIDINNINSNQYKINNRINWRKKSRGRSFNCRCNCRGCGDICCLVFCEGICSGMLSIISFIVSKEWSTSIDTI